MFNRIRSGLVLTLTLIFLFAIVGLTITSARYVSYPSASNDSTYDGDTDYSLAYQLRIYNVDQLIAAVDNGYSNIIIDESVANPLFVSGEELQVTSDLILDLNGHEIQRNDRDPMLNVTEGVKLTIVDTSADHNGSLYNPVGSVLNIAGGVLTTQAGVYESGPRKNEYYSNYTGNSSLITNGGTYRGGVIYSSDSVTVTVNTHASGVKTGTTTETKTMPMIIPQVIRAEYTDNGTTYGAIINGSIYFDNAYTTNSCDVAADTYFYVVMEGAESVYVDAEDAQYSYSYYVSGNSTNGYSYVGTSQNTTDDILVTVYAYECDKTVASDTDSSYNQNVLGREVSNFGAIKMQSGSLVVNGGSYYSYFGEDTSYCVTATGGNLSVSDGTFEALEEGVCVRSAADSGNTATGAVVISGGDFYSYKGDMAQVVDGTITVTGGTFTKDASAYGAATAEGENNSAIDLEGGTMTVSNAEIILNGSCVNGIKCQDNDTTGTDGVVTVTDSTFTYNGGSTNSVSTSGYTMNVGIVNYGGTITVTDCLFDTNDGESKGIKSESGTITANGCYFVLSGEKSIGIDADAGTVEIGKASDVSNTICMFYIDHVQNCYGIYSETSNTVTLNVNAAQFIMGQGYYSDTTNDNTSIPAAYTSGTGNVFNGAGIYLNASSNSAVNLKRAVFLMAGNYTAGVWAVSGEINQTDTASSGYTSSFLIGVKHAAYAGCGKYDSTYTNTSGITFYENKFNSDYFVALYGANTGETYTAATSYYTSGDSLNDLQFTGLSATGSTIGSYGIFSAGGEITAANVYVALCSTYGSGIYTSGGSITITSFQCDVRATDSTATTYPGKSTLAADVSSSAISSGSEGTANALITIGTSAINTDSYGYKINSGSLVFTGTNTLNSVRATAIYVNGADLEINSAAALTVTSTIATSNGWTDPSGDLLTDYLNLNYTVTDGTNNDTIQPDGIYVAGGSLNSSGTLNVTFAGVNNDTTAAYYSTFKITSYALRVAGSSSPTVTITSGEITSSIGGGVDVSAPGAIVTLGVSSAANTALKVTTEGVGSYVQRTQYYADGQVYTFASGSNWIYYLYQQGGHAIKVDDGTLTINSGTYYAAQGNGIYVNGADSRVTINDGIFVGMDNKSSSIGPGISYAVKLFDGQLYIFDGQFGYYTDDSGDTNYSNCVFIMGETVNTGTGSSYANYSCQGYFYGGTYDCTGISGSRTMTVIGYCYTQIGSIATGYNPTLKGNIYGIGLESMGNSVDNSKTSLFAMYSGTVTASSDGLWIGNAKCTINIYGGSITGSDNAIEFNTKTDSKVTISSATITGSTNGVYFGGTVSETVTIGSSTVISGANGVRFNSAVSGALSITGGAKITGTTNGILFNGVISGGVSITNAEITGSGTAGISVGAAVTTNAFNISGSSTKVTGSNGMIFSSTCSANINISSGATVYTTTGGNGIRFTSSSGVFDGDYTFTIDNATVYGGAGIRWYNVSTGSYGTFKICNGATVHDNNNYQALQFDSALDMAIVIDGSTTTVYGGNCAIQFGSSATFSSSITVSNSAKLYNTKTGTGSGVINFQGSSITGDIIVSSGGSIEGYYSGIYLGATTTTGDNCDITLTGGSITTTSGYGIYIASASICDVTITGGSITSPDSYAIYFGGTMSGDVSIIGSTITSTNSHAIYFNSDMTGALAIGQSGADTTAISASLRGINFNVAPTQEVNITNAQITANNCLYFADTGGIESDINITGSTFNYKQAGVYFAGYFSHDTGTYALTIDSTTMLNQTDATSPLGALYFNSQTYPYGSIVIQNGSRLQNTSGSAIYAKGNYNVAMTVTDSSVIQGSTYAIYIGNQMNSNAVITLYSSTALINGSGYYQIYVVGTNSGTVTCSDGSTVTVNSTSYTG